MKTVLAVIALCSLVVGQASYSGSGSYSGSAVYSLGSTINAASCSSADFQTAINSSADGDTVQGPVGGGSATWTVNLVVHSPNRSLIIDGKGCNITLSGVRGIQMFTSATNYPRITNFTFTGGTNSIDMEGVNQNFRIDHNTFTNWSDRAIYVDYGGVVGSAVQAYGVIDHNTFTNNSTKQAILAYGHNDVWFSDPNYGSGSAVYIEDDTFSWATGSMNPAQAAMDCEHGGRLVARHNDITDGTLSTHDTGSSPKSRSCRIFERYNNTFHNNVTDSSADSALSYRGSSGFDFNNSIPINGSGVNGWIHAIGTEIHRLTVGGGGVPMDFVVGADAHAVCSSFRGWCSNKGACDSDSNCGAGTCNTTSSPTDSTYCGSNGAGTNYISIANIDGPGSSPAGYPARDQTGVSKDDPTTHAQTAAGEPNYSWNNTDPNHGNALITGSTMVGLGSAGSYVVANREFYQQGASFDGTNGVGVGLLSARPGTCTAKVAYWATDTNTLYQCSATNTWTVYYTPYTYPHPLTQGSGGGA